MDKITLEIIPYKKEEQKVILKEIDTIDDFDKTNNEVVFYDNLTYDIFIFEDSKLFKCYIGLVKIVLKVTYADGKKKNIVLNIMIFILRKKKFQILLRI